MRNCGSSERAASSRKLCNSKDSALRDVRVEGSLKETGSARWMSKVRCPKNWVSKEKTPLRLLMFMSVSSGGAFKCDSSTSSSVSNPSGENIRKLDLLPPFRKDLRAASAST
eukprot:Lithocolla_globosa_v1_NODE_4072_length_1517_cov_4.981532.p3 type:complete len:112 gc:universal NODE_4072_length_1517_cov_4.981532:488-153(-)